MNFLVLSTGSNGSLWYAIQLSRHPDVFASCELVMGVDVRIKPEDGMKIFYERDDIRVSMQEKIAELRDRNIDEIFDRNQQIKPEARFVGDVHGFDVVTYVVNLTRCGLHRQATVANLVRHPVTYTEKCTDEWRISYERTGDEGRRILRDVARRIYADTPALQEIFDFDRADARLLSFLYTTGWVCGHMRKCMALSTHVRTFLFERLLTEREYYADCFNFLMAGKLQADDAYLDLVFDAGSDSIGRSRRTGTTARVTAAGQYERWTEVERRVFSTLIAQHGVAPLYAHCGYDFDFLEV